MYLGIDIGGTKTLIASFDDTGTLTEKIKFPTPDTYPGFLKALREQFEQLTNKEYQTCAIGMPGRLDRATGTSIYAGGNLTWQNSPIVTDVSLMVGCRTTVENDANTAGLGEARLVQDSYRSALYLTISTGIGGVLVIDGVIDQNTINAEVGHMIYKQPDGSYKTWEALASGKAIVERFGQRAEDITDPDIWRAVTEPIAMGIINVAAALTPDVIIIGGGAGANLHRFSSYLDEWLTKINPRQVPVPPIIEAQRPDDAVIYGCYELARQLLEQ